MPSQVESTVETPEQLLRSLELELAQRRAGRERSQGQRVVLLTGGLLLVVAAASAALLIAFSMLNDLTTRERPEAPPASSANGGRE